MLKNIYFSFLKVNKTILYQLKKYFSKNRKTIFEQFGPNIKNKTPKHKKGPKYLRSVLNILNAYLMKI